MLERHALFDMSTARAAFRRGKPARSNQEIPSGIGYFAFQELQELPHRGIRYGPGQVPVGHHPQDVEVFDSDDPAGARQFGGELVLAIPADVGNLLMLARHLEPLLLIVLAKNGSLRFLVFGLLFLDSVCVAVCGVS
jgi:hypothetical protein